MTLTRCGLTHATPPSIVANDRLGSLYYFQRDYAASAASFQSVSHGAHPTLPSPYRWLAAALGQLGQTDEAR